MPRPGRLGMRFWGGCGLDDCATVVDRGTLKNPTSPSPIQPSGAFQTGGGSWVPIGCHASCQCCEVQEGRFRSLCGPSALHALWVSGGPVLLLLLRIGLGSPVRVFLSFGAALNGLDMV
jgi:hypothetical protein